MGSALVRCLSREGYDRLLVRSRAELDLRRFDLVASFFEAERPDYVFLAAATVGGIGANAARPVEFLENNLLIQTNVIHNAFRYGARKLIFLGSSCIYPKLAPQPISESALLTGPLEPTNDAYAIAKIAGIRLCQAYAQQFGFRAISLMPTNLYGPGDNFDLADSHVLPALIRKFHEAKEKGLPAATLWGTGTPRREFLHVDDMAGACLFVARNYNDPEIINVGVGQDLMISELAEMIRACVGFEGRILFDSSKPDGTPRKLLDVSKLQSFGWRASIPLRDGIASTYRWFLNHERELAPLPEPSNRAFTSTTTA